MVIAAKALKKTISYEEYLQMPEINLRYEIIDGEMIMSPAPTSEHQWFTQNLIEKLGPFVKRKKIGVALFAPIDVLIRKNPLKTRQPDILFLSTERTGVKGRDELKDMPVIEVSPDLVVEILSPSDRSTVLQGKLQDYARIGAQECWLISPEAETVEVLRFTPAGIQRVNLYGAGDTLRSDLLPGFKMKVDDIFA